MHWRRIGTDGGDWFQGLRVSLLYIYENNFLHRKEEFNMSQITDNDLKSRSEYVEIAVNSVEHCARY